LGTYQEELVRDCVSFLPDIKAGMDEIVDLMLASGLRRIAFFAENIDNFVQGLWLDDLRGSLAARGMEFDERLFYYGHKSFSGAAGIMRPVFDAERLPFDSVICLESSTAIEISHFAYAHSMKYGVEAITIATSDAFGRHLLPVPAIYYDNRFSDIAYQGVETLVNIIHGRDVPLGPNFLPPKID
jgi:DNA-binding LacI/PurR family transcriptional regulator